MLSSYEISLLVKCLNALSGVRGFLTKAVTIVAKGGGVGLNALSGVRGFLTQICGRVLRYAATQRLNALSGVRGFLTLPR